MKSISVLLTVFCFILSACDDETIDTVGGGGRFQVAVTITPPLIMDGNADNGEEGCLFNILPLNSFYQFKHNSPSYLITDEISVTKGQTVTIQHFGINNSKSLSCKNVKIEFILNGNIVRTENYNMGYNGSSLCPDGASLSSLNYIVP